MSISELQRAVEKSFKDSLLKLTEIFAYSYVTYLSLGFKLTKHKVKN